MIAWERAITEGDRVLGGTTGRETVGESVCKQQLVIASESHEVRMV